MKLLALRKTERASTEEIKLAGFSVEMTTRKKDIEVEFKKKCNKSEISTRVANAPQRRARNIRNATSIKEIETGPITKKTKVR